MEEQGHESSVCAWDDDDSERRPEDTVAPRRRAIVPAEPAQLAEPAELLAPLRLAHRRQVEHERERRREEEKELDVHHHESSASHAVTPVRATSRPGGVSYARPPLSGKHAREEPSDSIMVSDEDTIASGVPSTRRRLTLSRYEALERHPGGIVPAEAQMPDTRNRSTAGVANGRDETTPPGGRRGRQTRLDWALESMNAEEVREASVILNALDAKSTNAHTVKTEEWAMKLMKKVFGCDGGDAEPFPTTYVRPVERFVDFLSLLWMKGYAYESVWSTLFHAVRRLMRCQRLYRDHEEAFVKACTRERGKCRRVIRAGQAPTQSIELPELSSSHSCRIIDVRQMASAVPLSRFYVYPTMVGCFLGALTGARAITISNIRLQDISVLRVEGASRGEESETNVEDVQVHTSPANPAARAAADVTSAQSTDPKQSDERMLLVEFVLAVVKSRRGQVIPQTVQVYVGGAGGLATHRDEFGYWLQETLQLLYGITLSEGFRGTALPPELGQQRLVPYSADSFSANVNAIAVATGWPVNFFRAHALRSGFQSTMHSGTSLMTSEQVSEAHRTGSDATLSAQNVNHTAQVIGAWSSTTTGRMSAAQSLYYRQDMRRALVVNRESDPRLRHMHTMDPVQLDDPEVFHRLPKDSLRHSPDPWHRVSRKSLGITLYLVAMARRSAAAPGAGGAGQSAFNTACDKRMFGWLASVERPLFQMLADVVEQNCASTELRSATPAADEAIHKARANRLATKSADQRLKVRSDRTLVLEWVQYAIINLGQSASTVYGAFRSSLDTVIRANPLPSPSPPEDDTAGEAWGCKCRNCTSVK